VDGAEVADAAAAVLVVAAGAAEEVARGPVVGRDQAAAPGPTWAHDPAAVTRIARLRCRDRAAAVDRHLMFPAAGDQPWANYRRLAAGLAVAKSRGLAAGLDPAEVKSLVVLAGGPVAPRVPVAISPAAVGHRSATWTTS
jgi:hypothetical protein